MRNRIIGKFLSTIASSLEVVQVYGFCSLVPRPFPPPFFDGLQYKNGGEGLGESVTCVTSGRREGRRHMRGAVPDEESRGPSCNILSKNLRL